MTTNTRNLPFPTTCPQPTTAFPPCMTRRQAAAWLGISLRSLAELEADRRSKLPRVKLGGRVVYQVADLSRWLSERAGCT
jgi:hypothetical protein